MKWGRAMEKTEAGRIHRGEIRERGAPARNLARSPMNYSPLSFQQLLAMYDSMLLTAGALHLLAMGMDEEHRASLAA